MAKKVEFFEHTVLAFYWDSEYDKNTKYCKIWLGSTPVQKTLLFLPRKCTRITIYNKSAVSTCAVDTADLFFMIFSPKKFFNDPSFRFIMSVCLPAGQES